MQKIISLDQLQQIDAYRWRIPKGTVSGMRTDGIVFSSREILAAIKDDLSLEQTANIATLPGIVGPALAMPDIHQGYGFPIGGVAAFDMKTGVISPGGVGFDINCGVRLLTTNLTAEIIKPRLTELISHLFDAIPSGLGSKGQLKLSPTELEELLTKGARWAVEQGYGEVTDLDYLESNGEIKFADPNKVSTKAKQRGLAQLGSLGSGNHFLEIQEVEKIFDPAVAEIFGLKPQQIVVMIHTGSRGLGHQVCTDYVNVMRQAMKKYDISVPDWELSCAPVNSPEGQDYLKAMSAAANFAWGNRQMILHWTRQTFKEFFGPNTQIEVVYDVAHNIAKVETHQWEGKLIEVIVHRKGATRAFGPNHPELAIKYQPTGQPVLIPGSMGTASYVLAGTQQAMEQTFGSVCHGAGRVLSRHQATKLYPYKEAVAKLQAGGLIFKTASPGGLLEEMPAAYKDIDHVIEVVVNAGIAKKIAKLKPLAVIKG
ncbi:MAG: RtcB family protein [Patescibacteria group bacterium]